MAATLSLQNRIRNLVIGFAVIGMIVAVACLPFLKYHRYATIQTGLYSFVVSAVAFNLYRCLTLAKHVGMSLPIALVAAWLAFGVFGAVPQMIELWDAGPKGGANFLIGMNYLVALLFALGVIESLMRKATANAQPK